MAFTRLQLGNSGFGRKKSFEAQDIREAFLRSLKKRWGENVPIEVKSVRAGFIKVGTASAVWRAELIWSADEIKDEINQALNGAVRRILIYLD